MIAGGIIGVDAGTGANLDLRPNPMRARLEPADSEFPLVILRDDKGDDTEKEVASEGTDATPADAGSDEAGTMESAPAGGSQ